MQAAERQDTVLSALKQGPVLVNRAKALLALSCLVRHSPPAMNAFHAANGMHELATLVEANAPAEGNSCTSHQEASTPAAGTESAPATSQTQVL